MELDYNLLKELLFKQPDPFAAPDAETQPNVGGEVIAQILEPLLKRRFETFKFSKNSQAAINDLMAGHGQAWIDQALFYIRSNAETFSMLLAAGFIGYDLLIAMRAQKLIDAEKEEQEQEQQQEAPIYETVKVNDQETDKIKVIYPDAFK